jgi:DNA-3-methyladenine glycosylase I
VERSTQPPPPAELAGYLEELTRSVFQPGLSWKVVEAKWPGMRAALHDFDPARVAGLTPPEVNALAQDTHMIRNRRKIEATVENAAALIRLDREHGGFATYLASHPSVPAAVADLRKRVKFLGDVGGVRFLWSVGVPIPDELMCAPAEDGAHARPMLRPHAESAIAG